MHIVLSIVIRIVAAAIGLAGIGLFGLEAEYSNGVKSWVMAGAACACTGIFLVALLLPW